MVEIIFSYDTVETIIKSYVHEKMQNIINKFKNKIAKDNFLFIYGGKMVNEELSFEQQANELDKARNKMNILVYDNNNTIVKEKIITSKESICPDCGENILVKIKDYKINYECKTNHIKENILLKEYEESQKIKLSNLLCHKCLKSSNNIFNNQFYFCSTCGFNLCPLCKSIHDNNHNIIIYDLKNYFCKKHNDSFIKYCKTCKQNLCFLCGNEHDNHEIINLEDIMIKKDEYNNDLIDFRNVIDKLKCVIEEMKGMLNNIVNNIDLYYKINENIFNNYENNKRNYYFLQNLNEFKNNNKNIIEDLNVVIKEGNYINKFNELINMYNKINNKQINNRTEIDEEGNKYIGEFKNGLRNGKGILYYNSNDYYKRNRYEGEWKNGLREGKGILYWDSCNK